MMPKYPRGCFPRIAFLVRGVRRGVSQGSHDHIPVQMARGGGLRAEKGGCSPRSLATRPSKTLSFLQGNKHFCKIALLHPKMVGIVS